MNVTGFNHATIAVTDLKRSIAFYRDVLEMKLVHYGRKDAYLEWGTAWVCLAERPELGEADKSRCGVDHLAFSVPERDVNEAWEKLRDRGVRVVRGPIERGTGRSVNFLDPDGTELELHTTGLRERMTVWS